MVNTLCLAGMLMLVLAVAVAAALLEPDWARDVGLERLAFATPGSVWDWRDDPVTEPDEDDLAVQRRILEKERVACELIDGRLTLFEAAALFRRLNEAPPRAMDATALRFPGDSGEERLCRLVIHWAWRRLHECYPAGADELAARYEDELRRHKEWHGRVVLPDLDAP
jgi:hypothetical protein